MHQLDSDSQAKMYQFWIPAVVASLLLVLAQSARDSRLLDWDEVDYAVAAGQGFKANYLDSTSLSATNLFKFIRMKIKNQPTPIADGYNEENDVFIRRHMHPPLMQYLICMAGLDWLADGPHDYLFFRFQLAGGCLLIFLITGSLRWFSEKPLDLPTGIVLTAFCFLCAFHLTQEIQYHLWFAITFCLVALGLGAYLKTPDINHATWLGGLLGLSFLALETGLFAYAMTIFVILLSVLPPLNRQFARNLLRVIPWRHFVVISVVMSICIFILWPASVLKLSLPRILAIYAYRIYLGNEYAGNNWGYLSLLQRSLPLVFLGVFGLWTAWNRRNTTRNTYQMAFAMLGLLYALLMFKFMLHITYMIPALVVLGISGLSAFHDMTAIKYKTIACLPIVGLTGWIYYNEKPITTNATREGMNNLASWIEKNPALIEAGHIHKFYLPQYHSKIQEFIVTAKSDSILVRQNMKYEPLTPEAMNKHLILFYNRADKPVSPIENHIRSVSKPIKIPGIQARVYLYEIKKPNDGK